MRIAIVIEARDGDGPINTIKLAESMLQNATTIEEVMERLRRCYRFVRAMEEAERLAMDLPGEGAI